MIHHLKDDTWRIFRIMAEFVDGFEFVANAGPTVTIFGSARTKPGAFYYEKACELAQKLVKGGYGVITGGGPGIMEAGNRGATLAGGKSIGFNIELPMEQEPNPFIKTLINFHYFFCRKVMFLKETKALVIFPGGYGTMDEFFEALTLVQTGRAHTFPVILVGSDFWSELVDWIRKHQLGSDYIVENDLDIFHLVDDVNDVLPIIRRFYRNKPVKKKAAKKKTAKKKRR